MAHDSASKVKIERNYLTQLSDGASLAADLHLPAGEGSFPTLICYYPYHKGDVMGSKLEYPRYYFAERGYACLLVTFAAWEALKDCPGKRLIRGSIKMEQRLWSGLRVSPGVMAMWGCTATLTMPLPPLPRQPNNHPI